MEWMILPLKRYAEFSGRSRRKEYWLFALFQFLVYIVLGVVAAVMMGAAFGAAGGASSAPAMVASMGIFGVVIGLFWLATILPSIAVAVRRLHDTDRTGWWLLAYVVPYLLSTVLAFSAAASGNATPGSSLGSISGILSLVGFIAAIVLLVFMVLPGTRGPNRYGSDPKHVDGDVADVFR